MYEIQCDLAMQQKTVKNWGGGSDARPPETPFFLYYHSYPAQEEQAPGASGTDSYQTPRGNAWQGRSICPHRVQTLASHVD
jgi:hypothetical protein